MKRGTIILLIVLGVVVLLMGMIALSVIGGYNAMVQGRLGVQAAWAQVEVQLQRRYDLIPNLVETVKGYATHEREVFLKVTEARARVGSAATFNEKVQSQNELTSALSRLLVVMENYPQLQANQNFIRLQDELAGTENRISVERGRFNDKVREYNTMLLRFPRKILANLFGFQPAEFLAAPTEARTAPKVDFSQP